MTSTSTWIMVANGAEARTYQYQGPKHKLTLVKGAEFSHINLPNRELTSTRPGRFFDPGDMRSADSSYDPHELEKKKFARELVEFLESRRGEFGQLVLAAPPTMLGYLRENLPRKNSLAKNIITVDKDFTKASEESLEKHMQPYLDIDADRLMKEDEEAIVNPVTHPLNQR